MEFEKDVFISYAHIDNLTLKSDDFGWITEFHRALEVRLSQLRGEQIRIWRDQKLQGNDFFGDEIVDQFPETAVMVSVISPRYLKSEWCLKEVKEFTRAASHDIGVRVGNKSRIFKIIKTFVPYDSHPPEIADILGYEFYISDPETGKPKELAPDGELETTYFAKLDDVAHDICDLLDQLEDQRKGPSSDVGKAFRGRTESELTVYLAETSSDLSEERDTIKRELTEYGYQVLPDSRLPYVESDFNAAVEGFLEQCVLSIHLVGGSYGMVPEGAQQSILDLQNELAARRSKTGKLQRLIWMMPYMEPDDVRQQQFIYRLKTDADSLFGADLMETSMEDFKLSVHDRLQSIRDAGGGLKENYHEISTVFLAETNSELTAYREILRRVLAERGCRVLPEQSLPLVYTELVDVVSGLLEECDASIHLMGEDFGIVPEKTEKSVIRLQLEETLEKSRAGKLDRVIRLSPTYNNDDHRQVEFMETVKKENDGFPGDNVFPCPLADVVTAVLEKMDQIEAKRRKSRELKMAAAAAKDDGPTEPSGPALIYLICDNRDLDSIADLEDLLYDSGYDVIVPAFEGEEAALMEDHKENLKTCDAVLIYFGHGNDLWLRSVTRDLSKAAGYGRTKPLDKKAVYLAPPDSRSKERFRSHGFIVLNGMDGFAPEILDPFMESLKNNVDNE